MPVKSLLRGIALSALLGAGALPAVAQVNAGAYLAARQATAGYDFAAAAQYFSRALARDPRNPALMEFTATSYLALGDIDRATTIARQMLQAGAKNQIANMILLGQAAKAGEWDRVIEDIEAGQTVGPLFDGLLKGWALVGQGDMDAAAAQFDAVAETQGVSAFGRYHKALALASQGMFEQADAVLSDPVGGGLRLTRRGLVARAQILSQLGRQTEAVTLLTDVFGSDVDRALEQLITQLEAGDTVPFSVATTPTEGVGEVFFSIANALSGDAAESYTLLYARMAEHLRPGHIEATLLIAGLLEQLKRYDLAIESYALIPREDPAWEAAELGRADALRRSGKPEAAIEVVRQLTALRPDLPLLHVTLGDILRELDRFEEAGNAYDQAIALFGEPDEAQWIVYFARGIARERTDRFDLAESDFRQALDLKPDQPQVLNYLGYSLVEQRRNLDEALDMIQRAVAARPDSGYIADSLGWVFYRLGRYDEAVVPMEKAVELMPVDPVINDHLGDVYWAVGRTLEARFQWKRALSFVDPDDADSEADPDRMRRKLEVGLDRVLEEEGAPPLKVANGG